MNQFHFEIENLTKNKNKLKINLAAYGCHKKNKKKTKKNPGRWPIAAIDQDAFRCPIDKQHGVSRSWICKNQE